MTPQQIDLIRQSFCVVHPIAEQAAALFYDNLFTADPSLRPMFKSEMAQQGHRLMSMIGTAIGLLGKPDKLLPAVRALGARHAGYGVLDAHYDTVGVALLKTLEQGLGSDWTPEVKDAWTAWYAFLSRTMMDGAHQPAEMA